MPAGGKHRSESTPHETAKPKQKRRKLGSRKRGMLMGSKGAAGTRFKST